VTIHRPEQGYELMVLYLAETVHSVGSSHRSDTRLPEVAGPPHYHLQCHNKQRKQRNKAQD